MSDPEAQGGVSREELLQRLSLMESMMAEGRRTTAHYGWCFVLWGAVDLAGMGLQWSLPQASWPWPVVIALGFVLQAVGVARLRKMGRVRSRMQQSRSVQAVWITMGISVTLYALAAAISHRTWQTAYIAGILTMVGMAHAISAVILRWPAQGAAAFLWLGSGIAAYFVRGWPLFWIVVADMFLGLVVFGIYVMVLERQRSTGARTSNV